MCFEVQLPTTGTLIHISCLFLCLLSLLRLCYPLTECAKTISVEECIRVHAYISKYATFHSCSFLLWMCVHKSLLNAFPRSELLEEMLWLIICVPSAWLSPDWPHLTPPAGSITDPHLSHFLYATYTPSAFLWHNPSLFPFQWLQVYKVTQEAAGSRKMCQRSTVWQEEKREGQDGPERTHCPLLYPPPHTHLQLPSCHQTITRQDITEMVEKQ